LADSLAPSGKKPVSTYRHKAIANLRAKAISMILRIRAQNWMAFHNTRRPHSALDRQTPDDAYWAGLEERHAA
jgi:transposase InsO family protein